MKFKQLSIIALAGIITAGFSSCDKDEEIIIPAEYEARVTINDGETVNLSKKASLDFVEGTITREGNIYSLRDFRILEEVEEEMDGEIKVEIKAANAYGFDFKENDAVNEEDFMVSFGASERQPDLIVNTLKGYGLSYIDKSFENTTKNDDFVEAEGDKLGLGSWLKYMGGPTHHVEPIEDRTYIITKGGKAIFKFRVNSIYSGGKPEKEMMSRNFFFYSVDYQEFK